MTATRRCKVAHLTSVHDPADTRIVHRECATLAENGYEVVLVAQELLRAMPPGVRHRTIPAPRNRFERVTKTVWALYRAALDENADIYHFHDPELIPVGFALRIAGKQVLFDVHEDIPHDIATKPWVWAPLRPIVACAATLVLRAVQTSFTAIVAATPTIAKRFARARTVVVANYPRCEELSNRETETSYQTRAPVAIYLGEITLVRGIEQMVRAMAQAPMLPESRLLLVGNFEDEALARRVSLLPGWERTIALGRRQRAELPAILARARVGLLVLQPAKSFEDSLPTKLLEYMAAGLPVVASNYLRCRELIESVGCGVLVDPRDCAAIATALADLLAHPERARAMGERGRAAVRARYDWPSEAGKLLALYAQTA